MNKIIHYIILLLGAVSLSTCIVEDEEPPVGNNLGVGDKIPQFSVIMNNGKMICNEDLIGNVSLIVFLIRYVIIVGKSCLLYNVSMNHIPNIRCSVSVVKKVKPRLQNFGKVTRLQCPILHRIIGRFINCLLKK